MRQRGPAMTDWLVVLFFVLGIVIGWVSRMRFEAAARRDEQIVDEHVGCCEMTAEYTIEYNPDGTVKRAEYYGRTPAGPGDA